MGRDFSTPTQASPGVHTASYTKGIGSFPSVKQPRHGVDHPSPFSTEVKEKAQLYIYSPSGPSWPVMGKRCVDVPTECPLMYI